MELQTGAIRRSPMRRSRRILSKGYSLRNVDTGPKWTAGAPALVARNSEGASVRCSDVGAEVGAAALTETVTLKKTPTEIAPPEIAPVETKPAKAEAAESEPVVPALLPSVQLLKANALRVSVTAPCADLKRGSFASDDVGSTESGRAGSLHSNVNPSLSVPVATAPAVPPAASNRAVIPGLAKLAADATVAAVLAAGAQSPWMSSVQAGSSARHNAALLVPDRIARTMEVADAHARDAAKEIAGAAAAQTAEGAATGRSHAPPLPKKERPKFPRALAQGGLGSRAAVAVALELPSSRTLFNSTGRATSLYSTSRSNMHHLHLQGVPSANRSSMTLPRSRAATARGSTAVAGAASLEEWLRQTDMQLPSNNHVDKPLPFPPGDASKSTTFNSYHYVPAEPSAPGLDSVEQGSGELGASSIKSGISPRPTTGSSGKFKGRVVRVVSVLPPSHASSRNSISAHTSIHSPASQRAISNSNSPLNSPLNSPVLSHFSNSSKRASITSSVSIPVSTRSSIGPHAEHSQEALSNTACVQASATPSSFKNLFVEDPQMNALPYPHAGAGGAAYGAYTGMGSLSGPNVLSAPPDTNDENGGGHGAPGDGFAEPSAPVFPEPTAPELPILWGQPSPGAQACAFPMPTHYGLPLSPAPAYTQLGFTMPPPQSIQQQQQQPMMLQQQMYQNQLSQQMYVQQCLYGNGPEPSPPTYMPPPVMPPTVDRPLPPIPKVKRPPLPNTQRPRPVSVPLSPPPPPPPKNWPDASTMHNMGQLYAQAPAYGHSQGAYSSSTAAISAEAAASGALSTIKSSTSSEFVIVSINPDCLLFGCPGLVSFHIA
ncbi:hypothetical protein GGF37_003211 [Kickxella alabastrina]|nr:hypothetical protein GGF37_003211 [Kickxella alabastrina]